MILRYSFGKMIETDAVPVKPIAQEGLPARLAADEASMSFSMPLGEKDVVYGLGENVRGINKRGWFYRSNTVDEPDHCETRNSLYAAHNFILIDGEDCFALFFDYAGIMSFDVGYTRLNELKICVSDWNFDLYVIEGGNKIDLVRQFRRMIGKSYLAPKWAFGYGQSRWSYRNAEEIREVVRRHREAQVPLDLVYMDIDYMDGYKDFTVSEERFGDLASFSKEMKDEHIRLIPIVDAGIKQESGYSVYDEGLAKGYFCTKEDGSPFIAAVWPGKACFVDVMNPEARAWFGRQYAFYVDKGIEGFWNDMNEPSIFYTEDRLDSVIAQISQMRGENMDADRFWYFQDLVSGLKGNEADWKCFYHRCQGEKLRHDRVHNLFGYFLTRGSSEELTKMMGNRRFLLISRASATGLHRYSGIWMGDNRSWWSHLLLNMQMLPSLNMQGFLYTGCDLGGLTCDVTEDLMLRWLAMGVFYPLMRNHSAIHTRRQEFYEFERVEAFRAIISLRYRLIPYLYSEYMKAALRDEMMFRPLSFDYPEDEHAPMVEDQLMLGHELMIAPVYRQNADGRYVYLPERMKLLRFREDGSLEEEVLEKGHHYVKVALSDVVFFLREGKTIPLAQNAEYIEALEGKPLDMLKFGEGELSYELYDDDGVSFPVEWERNICVLKA